MVLPPACSPKPQYHGPPLVVVSVLQAFSNQNFMVCSLVLMLMDGKEKYVVVIIQFLLVLYNQYSILCIKYWVK